MKNKSKKQEEKNNKNQNQKQKKIPGSIKKAQNKILIVVGAKPNSKQSKISQINDEYVGINIGAPPKQGEANQELLAHLSYVLDVKKNTVYLDKGSKSKHKIVVIQGQTDVQKIYQKLKIDITEQNLIVLFTFCQRVIVWMYHIYQLMQCCFSSLNTKGFESALQYGQIPQSDHITYEGCFNELSFTIGPKAKLPLELHIGYSKCQNINSQFNSQINDYLAIFTKGFKDGQDRDDRILNSVVCLDISGSMGSGLTKNGQGHRLTLAKQAIKMFYSKLRQTDSFGLVVFDTKAETLIKSAKKQDLPADVVFQVVDSIQTRGGTTLITGFKESERNLRQFLESQNYSKNTSQNRIIMLTDVGDNSVSGAKHFVSEVSEAHSIHVTIIGVSDDFQSSTCEQMIEIQGFNYFCATQLADLKKYLFQNFNFTFFPANYNIQIQLIQNQNVKKIEVFGTVDAKKVAAYNGNFNQIRQNLVITKTKTSFPSQIQITKEGVLKTYGGLIMVKLSLLNKKSSFNGKVRVSYTTPKGQKGQQIYDVSFQNPTGQQYYSEESLAEAMSAFFYVYQIKKILDQVNGKNVQKNTYKKFSESLKKLKSLCPESKKKQLDDMIDLLSKRSEQQPYYQDPDFR